MRIWFILLIKSDLKWCIHLSRSLHLYFMYNLEFTWVQVGHLPYKHCYLPAGPGGPTAPVAPVKITFISILIDFLL